MTKLELQFFYILDWSPLVTDIREHFPLLPLEDTLQIAGEFGIKHPADPRTKQPRVMTTDFLVTVLRGSQSRNVARSIVYAKRLGNRRTIEKLEIECEYWRERGTEWAIVTELDIPMVIAKNVALIHNHRDLTDRGNISESNVRNVTEVLTTKVLDGVSALRDVAAECDAELGLEPGTSLAVAYHLIATRYWQVDLNVPLEPGKPLLLHVILLEEPIRV